MLTIGYDGTAAIRQRAGIGRYARELLRALSERHDDDSFRVIAAARGATEPRPNLNGRFRWLELPVSDRVSNAVWHRARLPIPVEARLGRLDVFHSPDFSLAPSLAPAVVTIHDLAFEVMPQVSVPSLAEYLHSVVPRSVRRARAVISPSQSTKQAVMRAYGTASDKIFVIPEGVTTNFDARAKPDDHDSTRRLGLDRPYLLAAGTIEPRKNLERLVEAFSRLPPSFDDILLVFAGQRGWMDGGVDRKVQELKLQNRVRFLGYVSDAALASVYRQAVASVYVSLYEGFGLPGLEALACGSPLVAAGNSSLPEACGEAAVYVDPWDVDDIAATLESVLNDADMRQDLSSRGPRQAAKFTWAGAAEATSALYHRVAN